MNMTKVSKKKSETYVNFDFRLNLSILQVYNSKNIMDLRWWRLMMMMIVMGIFLSLS